jgi:hypothetical protein
MFLRHRLASVIRALLLAAVGLLVASPFLTWRGVGTGESYNYNLAVADATAQLRAGVFPVLVGQTPFAYNGRIHPLRDAPYLIYLAGAIDLLTGHRLGSPALQNLSLAFSLVASFFAAYAALRWGARCPPWPAVLLACLYGSSPALLAAAYSMDLYMTVHAAPFVALALGAVVCQATRPSPIYDFFLAAAVAAAWWAHPPVAVWLTMGCGLLRIVLWIGRPSCRGLVGMAGASVFGLLLSGFTFVSVLEITNVGYYFDAGARESAGFVGLVLKQVRQSFIGSVSPVSRFSGTLGDFQMGYVAWLLLALVVLILRQKSGPWQGSRLAAAGLAGVALLLAGMCVPVPYFTGWAWSRLPGLFYLLTNDWPMQRLYLIALAAVVLASGLVLGPRAREAWDRHPVALAASLVLAVGWMTWEVIPFLKRGYNDRWSGEVTRRNFLPSNIDLTGAAYTFLQAPASSGQGVLEPWIEFRLLNRDGGDLTASNYAGALATSPVVAQGTFRQAPHTGPESTRYDPAITLEPGRHYLLSFSWRTPPFPGLLSFVGPSLQRLYVLPHSGQPQSFGMGAGQRSALAISTSQSTAEPVQLWVLNPTENSWGAPPPVLADFKLLAVDETRLPVRVQSWLPLRAAVTAPTGDRYLETPRCFIPGYDPIVNGRHVRAVRSATGQVMFPVPAGESQVVLRYPGTPLLRAAFWTSLGTWLAGAAASGFLLIPGLRPVLRERREVAEPRRGRAAEFWRSAGWTTAGAGVVTVLAGIGWNHLHRTDRVPGTVGPLAVHLLLPKGMTSRQQPIVVTGRVASGNIIFLSYTDKSHVRVGVDVWGSLHLSDPVPVDYDQEQELVVSGGMLYPPSDPFVRSLPPFIRDQLRRELRVELNGHTVVAEARSTIESSPASITIGRSEIGGSEVSAPFSGKILRVDRLPVPLPIVLSSRPLRLQLVFPSNESGLVEPLLTVRTGQGAPELFTVKYLPGSQITLGVIDPHGTRIEGPARPARPEVPHTLELTSRGTDLKVIFDGGEALSVPGQALAPGKVELGELGVNATVLTDVRARFTGARLAPVTAPTAGPAPPATPDGPFRLVVLFPSGKPQTSEPLVVTGKTSKGDAVYVKYTNPGQIQFAYDHWGVGGTMSEPITVDYGRPHELEIGLGSLYPERKDAAWMGLPAEVRQRLRQRATVRLDGVAVWECQSPAYPSDPADIRVGENRIGASSCTTDFTGEILDVGRAKP